MGMNANQNVRLSLAALAHNTTASAGSTVAPITALTGRANFLSRF